MRLDEAMRALGHAAERAAAAFAEFGRAMRMAPATSAPAFKRNRHRYGR